MVDWLIGFLTELISYLFDWFLQVIEDIPQDEVELSLVRAAVGPVTQSDVEAAKLAQAPIFAFNLGNPSPDVKVGLASNTVLNIEGGLC